MSRMAAGRTGAVLLMLMLVAGCPAPEQVASREEVATGRGTSADEQDTASAEAPPFFVGRWAAADTACGHAAWTFTATGLATPGEVVCSFNRVTRTERGYDIDAICTAEGPPRPERIKLSYAQSAGALLIEGGPFNPVGLVACDGQRP